MITVNPYLTFNGNCLEAFNHYKEVFGGEFETKQHFRDEPGSKHPPAEGDKIMHVSLPLSKGYMLMGSDRPGSMGKGTIGENVSLSLDVDTRKEADRIFKELGEGGKITMPIADTFWGSYFGMLNDRFGVQWMVSFSEKR